MRRSSDPARGRRPRVQRRWRPDGS